MYKIAFIIVYFLALLAGLSLIYDNYFKPEVEQYDFYGDYVGEIYTWTINGDGLFIRPTSDMKWVMVNDSLFLFNESSDTSLAIFKFVETDSTYELVTRTKRYVKIKY